MRTKNYPTTATGGVEYIDAQQVRTRYGGRSPMWLWRMDGKDPSFPRPIKIGDRNFWRLADLIAWEASRHATA